MMKIKMAMLFDSSIFMQLIVDVGKCQVCNSSIKITHKLQEKKDYVISVIQTVFLVRGQKKFQLAI